MIGTTAALLLAGKILGLAPELPWSIVVIWVIVGAICGIPKWASILWSCYKGTQRG